MPFQALTSAPSLKNGVTLNIMAVPQIADITPERLSVGALVTLRLGRCCPIISEGRITACTADPERAVLRLDGIEWILEPSVTGILIPGIASEDWIVRTA